MTEAVLPGTPLGVWAIENEPDHEILSGFYWPQIMLVRDLLPAIFARNEEEYEELIMRVRVISTHTSKSVRLPVYQFILKDGTTFTLRYNFHDWKVSVNSPRAVKADFMHLFSPTFRIKPVYCEGFPKDLVYGPYAKNKRKFTFELFPSEHCLFTFLWIYAHKVLGKNVRKKKAAPAKR